jgi:hypothetical protein
MAKALFASVSSQAIASRRTDQRLLVGHLDEHVGVTELIERAVAGQVSAAQLTLDVLDGDPQPASDKVVAESTDRLLPAQLQRVGIAPLRRSTHHDNIRGEPRSLTTRALEPLRHRTQVCSVAGSSHVHAIRSGCAEAIDRRSVKKPKGAVDLTVLAADGCGSPPPRAQVGRTAGGLTRWPLLL